MSEADSPREPPRAEVPPADAFALIGDETRLGILEALWRLGEPARFSDIREEVGGQDSAKFNYHLGKLRGQYVRKTEDGYELRTAGKRVVQAIFAGSFTRHPEREIEITDPCIRCGHELHARYEDELLRLSCPACGHGHGEYLFPPGGLRDRSDAEILEAFDQRVRHLHCLAKDGVCPNCNGRVKTHVERGETCCLGARTHAVHMCQQCGEELCSTVGMGLLDQSPVVGFYADHGIDLAETPYWRLEWCVDDDALTVRSEDPWRIEVEMTAGDEALRVVADAELMIRETRRRSIDEH